LFRILRIPLQTLGILPLVFSLSSYYRILVFLFLFHCILFLVHFSRSLSFLLLPLISQFLILDLFLLNRSLVLLLVFLYSLFLFLCLLFLMMVLSFHLRLKILHCYFLLFSFLVSLVILWL